jgi:hypothetical protein
MTAAALAFPNSQTLAGWWRQLSARCPSAIWVGHVRIHRVEALADTSRTKPLDHLARSILELLDLERNLALTDTRASSLREGWPVSLSNLESALGLDSSLVRPVMMQLERGGLIASSSRSEDATAAWFITIAGRRALESGNLASCIRERRQFNFLESLSTPPQFRFVNLCCLEGGGPVAPTPSETEVPVFDLEKLKSCIREPTDWKHRHGFPEDVVGLVPLNDPAASEEPQDLWQRVPVDRLDLVCLALSREPGALHAFAVRPQGWRLQAASPCFSLDDGEWESLFPAAMTDPPLDAWRQAWLNWGQARHLPPAELEPSALEREGLILRVSVSKRVRDRVRASGNEPSKPEHWVLGGAGDMRACACLEIVAN